MKILSDHFIIAISKIAKDGNYSLLSSSKLFMMFPNNVNGFMKVVDTVGW